MVTMEIRKVELAPNASQICSVVAGRWGAGRDQVDGVLEHASYRNEVEVVHCGSLVDHL